MLFVYAGLNLRECDRRVRLAIPSDCIDMSKTAMTAIVSDIRTIYMHHGSGQRSVYLGFLDPLLMLTQPDEALCRQVFRKLDVYIVVSNPFILPLSWKNGISKLVIVGMQQDVEDAKALHDSGTAYVPRA
jgi:hypothetical protein